MSNIQHANEGCNDMTEHARKDFAPEIYLNFND